jgi:hypothetical protein
MGGPVHNLLLSPPFHTLLLSFPYLLLFSFPSQVSYKLSQYANLDLEINKRTDALQDVAFPTINKDTIRLLVSGTKYKTKAKDLDHIRSLLEHWIFSILSRIETFPFDLQILIENFFLLPDGPNYHPVGGGAGAGGGEENGSVGVGGEGDDESQTESEDPSVTESEGQSSSASSSFEKGKKGKKKRLMKGLKKRMSSMFQGKDSDHGHPSKSTPPPSVIDRDHDRDTMSDIRDSQSTVVSDVSIPYSISGTNNERHLIQTNKLLTSRVQRGGERSKGVFVYEVCLSSLCLSLTLSVSHSPSS